MPYHSYIMLYFSYSQGPGHSQSHIIAIQTQIAIAILRLSYTT